MLGRTPRVTRKSMHSKIGKDFAYFVKIRITGDDAGNDAGDVA